MLTMTDRFMDRVRRAVSILMPFVAVIVVVANGKRW
jgi:hypothetical protein